MKKILTGEDAAGDFTIQKPNIHLSFLANDLTQLGKGWNSVDN